MSLSTRYLRTEAVLGKEKSDKIRNSFVVVAGCGGVGGFAIEALARCGVKKIRVVDSDCFEETNLNRQLLCTQNNIGQSKVLEAKKRINEIDSSIEVDVLDLFINEKTIDEVLSGPIDIVLDAIDSVHSKCLLLSECKKRGIKVVSSMGAALRTDPTKIQVADISKTFGCPLAKQVRLELKQYGIENGIPCVFSPEHVNRVGKELGSLVTVVGSFGLALAQISIDRITDI